MPTSSSNVRSQEYTGRHLLGLSFSDFDPNGQAACSRRITVAKALSRIVPRENPEKPSP
jgi:hypothetical protein